MTTHQAVILLMLNTRHEVRIRDVVSRLGIAKENLTQDIIGLVHLDHPVLIKKPAGTDLDNSDTLSVNSLFKTGLNHVKFNKVRSREEVIFRLT